MSRDVIAENRMGTIIRQWALLRLVAAHRYMTVPLLADKLAVSRKTIRRDLLALEAAGFPLITGSTPQNNYVRLERDWFIRDEHRYLRKEVAL
jgi:predicted DNA-binding transcriptional regulator YafY